MERRPAVIGNWKMQLSVKASVEATNALKKFITADHKGVDIVICPSYPALADVQASLKKTEKIQLGAQNVHWEETGAWTGAVSVVQLKPYVAWCIVGHSEQRALSGETEEQVQVKANLLLTYGITPVICLGETLAEREADQTVTKVTTQVQNLFSKTTRVALTKMVIVYEPIWAISANETGLMPEPDEVAQISLLIRKLAAERFGNDAAQRLRILYGGSVTPSNVEPYVSEPGIDGVLVGGASLHPMDFAAIAKAVADHSSS